MIRSDEPEADHIATPESVDIYKVYNSLCVLHSVVTPLVASASLPLKKGNLLYRIATTRKSLLSNRYWERISYIESLLGENLLYRISATRKSLISNRYWARISYIESLLRENLLYRIATGRESLISNRCYEKISYIESLLGENLLYRTTSALLKISCAAELSTKSPSIFYFT